MPALEDNEEIVVLKVGHSAAPADWGVAMAAGSDGAATATIVLRASAAAIKHALALPSVMAAIPDRYVSAQARALSQAPVSCVASSTMRAGVSTLPDNIRPALVTAFTNLGCNVRSARYVWKGRLCRGSASAINYTEVAAVDRRSNAPLRSSRGALCRLVRGPNARVNRQRFGNCGVAPVLASRLPQLVCRATGGAGSGGGGLGLGTTPAGTVLPKVPLQPLEEVRACFPESGVHAMLLQLLKCLCGLFQFSNVASH